MHTLGYRFKSRLLPGIPQLLFTMVYQTIKTRLWGLYPSLRTQSIQARMVYMAGSEAAFPFYYPVLNASKSNICISCSTKESNFRAILPDPKNKLGLCERTNNSWLLSNKCALFQEINNIDALHLDTISRLYKKFCILLDIKFWMLYSSKRLTTSPKPIVL